MLQLGLETIGVTFTEAYHVKNTSCNFIKTTTAEKQTHAMFALLIAASTVQCLRRTLCGRRDSCWLRRWELCLVRKRKLSEANCEQEKKREKK